MLPYQVLNLTFERYPRIIEGLLIHTCQQHEQYVSTAPFLDERKAGTDFWVINQRFDTTLRQDENQEILVTRLPEVPGLFVSAQYNLAGAWMQQLGWRPQGDRRWLPPEVTCQRCPQCIGCALLEPL